LFSKDILIGVLIGLANCDIRVESNHRSSLGYEVKPRLQIRGEMDFLLGVERSLAQQSITCSIKEKESKIRPKPLLKVTRIGHLQKICEMIPEAYADARNQWAEFRTVVQIMNDKKHLTLEGLEEILRIKGLI
jgi:hypothetical protein